MVFEFHRKALVSVIYGLITLLDYKTLQMDDNYVNFICLLNMKIDIQIPLGSFAYEASLPWLYLIMYVLFFLLSRMVSRMLLMIYVFVARFFH
jgi:hypothetical protein